jgi:hypothetical protein
MSVVVRSEMVAAEVIACVAGRITMKVYAWEKERVVTKSIVSKFVGAESQETNVGGSHMKTIVSHMVAKKAFQTLQCVKRRRVFLYFVKE